MLVGVLIFIKGVQVDAQCASANNSCGCLFDPCQDGSGRCIAVQSNNQVRAIVYDQVWGASQGLLDMALIGCQVFSIRGIDGDAFGYERGAACEGGGSMINL